MTSKEDQFDQKGHGIWPGKRKSRGVDMSWELEIMRANFRVYMLTRLVLTGFVVKKNETESRLSSCKLHGY
jgi:hypothetical protein